MADYWTYSLRETTESLDLWYGLFLLRYWVYINHGMHPPPPLQLGREERGENFKEVFAGRGGVRNFYFGGEVCIVGGSQILRENLKLHNSSVKSIFRTTSWIYFRDIWKIYLWHKFWKNIFFNGNMSQVFKTLCCFSLKLNLLSLNIKVYIRFIVFLPI